MIALGISLTLYFSYRSLASIKPMPVIAERTVLNETIVNAGVPARLMISKIGIDAVIEPMGLTPSGDMEAPIGGRTVGWYKLGVYPGNEGSAVIDGHYGPWKNGDGSVFDNLNKLVAGDGIVVEDDKGALVTFIVREFRMFSENEDASIVFRSSDGKAHLNLITCQGSWIAKEKTFSNRLVVFADRQE